MLGLLNADLVSGFHQPYVSSLDDDLQPKTVKVRSKMKRKRKFFCMLLPLLAFIAVAQDAYPSDGTVVSQIVKSFHEKLSTYEQVMLKYAKLLFYWCAVLDVAWLGVKKALGSSDMRETLRDFCLVLLAAGFFLAVINNYHEWAWNVINGLKTVAGEATNIMDASDRPFTVGLELAKVLLTKTSFFNPIDSLTYVLAGFGVLICFALITLQIILIKCECIVAMCASSILLGFGASSFFKDYAVNALRYIVSVAFKLMTMQLVLGVGIKFISELQIEDGNWLQIGVTISFCLIFYCLVKTLPDVVAGIIQGSHVSSGNALTSTVTALGAGLAGLGMAAGAGVANVGRAAQTAKAEGAQGMGGMVSGTAGNLWKATRESMHNKDLRGNTVSSSLRERLESARQRKD